MQHLLYNNKNFLLVIILGSLLALNAATFGAPIYSNIDAQGTTGNEPYVGVDMRGVYTAVSEPKSNISTSLPANYYEDSFRIISEAGMNHVRYTLYWEAYVVNSTSFMNELQTVANTADKYGIKVIYDNHQFHTSSYLNPQRGNGFPSSLVEGDPKFSYGAGGSPKYETAKLWWTDWWNRSIRDVNGTDGWVLMLGFLQKIVNAIDSHPSTLGYEILSEPQVHSSDQWEKIGTFNSFMVNELRKITQKTLVYSMNIPVDLKSQIGVNPTNLAEMAPANKTNVVFKVSLYGLPEPDTYQGDRLAIFLRTSEITQVPLYVGEWNNVLREATIDEEGQRVFNINPERSDISQEEANLIVQTFKDIGAWGMAYWQWRLQTHQVDNYNLVNATDSGRTIGTTQYFNILKNAYQNAYGNLNQATALPGAA
ncbi:MAG TPA: cellulase family glycosylhydrolase [Nitrososphaeraceae archaeon]|nr:cellulase family glycosylhydrolase [Nitrososphaeraceae archaeon]